jgi:hypothetical protein
MVPLWASGIAMGFPQVIQGAYFDDGISLTRGLTWSFSRPSEARNADGSVSPFDTARYAPPTMLAGAPTDLEVISAGNSIGPLTAGYDADAVTPVLVVDHSGLKALDIHVGHNADKLAYQQGDLSKTYRFYYADPARDNNPNLLKGQIGLNDGTPSLPGYAFVAQGAQTHAGLIVVQCDVLHDDNGDGVNYKHWKTALLYTTIARLKSGLDPWIVAGVSKKPATGNPETGQSWSINGFALGADEYVACVSSYESSPKNGGHTYVARFVNQGDWGLADICMMAESTAPSEHYHCAGVISHPDARMSVLISIGDSLNNNRLLARTLGAGGDWSGEGTWDGSGINGAFEIKLASTMWTPATAVWGSNDPNLPRLHNQAVDMVAADPQLSALLCTADEGNPAVIRLEYDPGAKYCLWTGLYLPSISSWPSERTVNLAIEGRPGGPYVSRLGAQTWQSADFLESRVLYSPDGVQWTQCMAPNVRPQAPIAIADGRIWIGAVGINSGLRSIDVPSTLIASPLQLAGEGHNYLANSIAMPTNVGQGVVVTKLPGAESLPDGVPPPPCDDANIFRITGTANSGTYGIWRPAGPAPTLPAPAKSVMVRYWLYLPTPDDVVFVEHASLSVWSRIKAIDGSGNVIIPKQARTDPGVWMPVTPWFTLDQFGGNPMADPWNVEIQLAAVALSPQPSPSDFLIAWEGIFIDPDTIDGHGADPQTPGAAEIGAIDGWALGQHSTLVAYGWVPFDAWDNRMGGGLAFNEHRHPLLRLIDSKTNETLDVIAEPDTFGFGLVGDDSEQFDSGTTFWLRGSPVLMGLVSSGGDVTLYMSVGGGPVRSVTLEDGAMSFDRVEIGHAPMLWRSIEGVDAALGTGQILDKLESLGPFDICPADVNGDGLLNILDFIYFQNAFVAQDPVADCTADARFNILDFVCFQNLFANGCP